MVIDDLSLRPETLDRLNRMLAERFDRGHPTLQPELAAGTDCDRGAEACR